MLQYSRLGRTIDLLAFSLIVLELIFELRFRKPRVCFVFEKMKLICEFHLRYWEMCTPRDLILGTEDRVWPWRMKLC